ncbi:hypothetical protein C8Q80DRAFT_1271236 [Daedaleopsis nitida]|nr:hypothetical protein C8Q80DRAFT_1271236 [Daedaleopsis nitida]
MYGPKTLHTIFVEEQDVYVRDTEDLESVDTRSDLLTVEEPASNLIFVSQGRPPPPPPRARARAPVRDGCQAQELNPRGHQQHDSKFFEVTAQGDDLERMRGGAQAIDMIGWMGRTALELIGQGGFGYSFNSKSRTPSEEDQLPDAELPVRGSDGAQKHEVSEPKGTTIVTNILACDTSKAILGTDVLEWESDR